MLAAEIHYPRNLSVDRVEAELLVAGFLSATGCLVRQRQLKGLQEPGLVIIEVSDAIHGHPALSTRWVTAT